MEDAKTWKLYTWKDGYLSISPNPWTPSDLSKETQVTIIRSERVSKVNNGSVWEPWPEVYPKCKAGVAEVIKRNVEKGKLEGRHFKRQFEILSSDFIVDTNGDVWLFEFNMSPVLKDPQDSPNVHDGDMITAALDLVLPREGGTQGNWDFAGEFVGEVPPLPERKVPASQGDAADAGAPSVVPAAAGGAQDEATNLQPASTGDGESNVGAAS